MCVCVYLNVIKQPRNKPASIWSIILTKETRIYNVYCKEMVKTTSSIRHAGKTGETHAKKKKKIKPTSYTIYKNKVHVD